MDDAERLAAFLAELATQPTTHWVHVIEHDHRQGLRIEHTIRCTDLTPQEAIASRIQRLRNTPPTNGWSRDGSTLHIRHTDRESWVTYLPADAHTETYRKVADLNNHEEPQVVSAVVDVPLPGMTALA